MGVAFADTKNTVERMLHKIVLAGRRMKVSGIAETAGISTERVCPVSYMNICTTKLCARWAVSYTHLDVYKRQPLNLPPFKICRPGRWHGSLLPGAGPECSVMA